MIPFFSRHDPAAAAAAEWMSRRDAGLAPEQEGEFQDWLQSDRAHAAAWTEAEAAWATLGRARERGVTNAVIRELAERRRRRRLRRNAIGTIGAAAAVILAFVSLPRRPAVGPEPALVPAAPVLLRPDRQVLADGSVVELNVGAAITVNYSPARRDVRLLRGEAHFDVAKNPARPFVVTAGAVAVRAVGTHFVVRFQTEATDVLVTEGRVAVDRMAPSIPAGQAAKTIFVSAGNRLSVPAVADPAVLLMPEPVAPAEAERLLAWRGPRLVLSDTTLADAITSLNRENKIQILIRDRGLAAMRLSGVFRADNAEGFVRLLESTYGVKVERRGTQALVLGSP